jgi:hypothetical protein
MGAYTKQVYQDAYQELRSDVSFVNVLTPDAAVWANAQFWSAPQGVRILYILIAVRNYGLFFSFNYKSIFCFIKKHPLQPGYFTRSIKNEA